MVARTRWIVLGVVGAVAAVAAACSGFSGSSSESTTDAGNETDSSVTDACAHDAGAPTDASIADATDAATPMCDVDKPFGAPTLVTELNTSGNDFGVRLSADYLTAYFASAKDPIDGGQYDLWTATRASITSPFAGLTAIDAIDDTTYLPGNASITGDGLSLYFNATTTPNANLYVATRASTSASFSALAEVANVNINPMNVTPYVTEDGQAIYFASGANDFFTIYVAQRGTSGFSAPEPFNELHTMFGENTPVITSDGLTLYYGSLRTVGNAVGGFDVWVATRPSTTSQFGAPRDVTELNTIGTDLPSFITRDRCTLYLRHDEVDAGLPTMSREIYVATKTP